MEPTIYKPSIYKGTGVYNTGAGGGGGDTDYIEINGKKYNYVKIGNLFFTTKNLNEVLPGINYNSGRNTVSNCKYPNQGGQLQTATGLMYNCLSLQDIENAVEGWRIPTENDINNLYSQIGNDGLKIRSKFGWDYYNYESNDETGFNLIPTGYIRDANSYDFRNRAHMQMSYSGNYNSSPMLSIDNNGAKNTYYRSFEYYAPVRLCRDA